MVGGCLKKKIPPIKSNDVRKINFLNVASPITS